MDLLSLILGPANIGGPGCGKHIAVACGRGTVIGLYLCKVIISLCCLHRSIWLSEASSHSGRALSSAQLSSAQLGSAKLRPSGGAMGLWDIRPSIVLPEHLVHSSDCAFTTCAWAVTMGICVANKHGLLVGRDSSLCALPSAPLLLPVCSLSFDR